MEKQVNTENFEARLAALRERKAKERKYFEMLLNEVEIGTEEESKNGNAKG